LLLESIIDAVFIADLTTRRLVDCNKVAERLIGRTRKEILAMRADQLHPPDRIQETMRQFEKQARGEIVFVQTEVITKKGGRIPVEVNATGNRIDGKQYVLGIFRDITERKRADELLRLEQARVQNYFDVAGAIMMTTDDAGRVTGINRKGCEILGYPEEYIVGKVWVDHFIPRRIRKTLWKMFRRCVVSKSFPDHFKNPVLAKTGEKLISWYNVTLVDDKGRMVLLSSGEDITEDRKVEDALRQSEEKYRAMVEDADDQIFVLDNKYRFLSANKTVARLLRKPVESIVGKPIAELFPKEIAARFQRNCRCVFKTSKKLAVEERIVVHGQESYVSSNLAPIKDANGSIVAVSGIVRDITEQKRTESAILFKNALLEGQYETSMEGILVVGPDGKTVSYNSMFSKIWGIPRSLLMTKDDNKMIGYVIGKLKDPDSFVRGVRHLYVNKEEKSRDEIGMKDGRVLDRYSSPFYDSAGEYRGRIWFFRDITDLRQAEHGLKETAETYKALYDLSTDAIMQLTPERGFFSGNPATVRLFKCRDEAEFIRCSPVDLSPPSQPDGTASIVKAQQMMAIALETGVNFFEWTHRCKDGTDFPATVLLTRMELKGKLFLQATVRDVTERKKAEEVLRSKNSELERFNQFAIGREIKMVELKKEINALRARIGEASRYGVQDPK
jgi:PAS domain S-box-containing protein